MNTWNGLSFECLCMNHISQIKRKPGIEGILSNVQAWSCRKTDEKGIHGCQTDCLIVRRDNIINLCEMKFSSSENVLSGKDAASIRRKHEDFIRSNETKYAVYPTIITTYGLVDNEYSHDIQSVMIPDDLFAF